MRSLLRNPKLPDKSLTRFNSHISSPEFSQEHFNYQTRNIINNTINDNISVSPVFRRYSQIENRELYFAFCSGDYKGDGSQSVQFAEIKSPESFDVRSFIETYYRPAGSCDGLTCFFAGEPFSVDSWLIPWNASMQEIDTAKLPANLANGRKVHWRANCEDENGEKSWKLVLFFVSDEVFDHIPLPECLAMPQAAGGGTRVELAWLDYCVCTWTMKEYGVAGTWTEFAISLDEPAKPLGFLSKTLFLFLLRGGEVVSYDIRTQRKDYLGASMSLCVGNYMESLFKFKSVPIRYSSEN
ncbi:hypothetical protein TorRG33x02_064050 [Trema orientale]|uniref:F-box associated domain n=1 Tax=Trema orientale TaxID=63057 RepID=A0A2P5FJ35_TREOI|nr:hypothetical protein TorRG33x02_064050 [Trema orientale]